MAEERPADVAGETYCDVLAIPTIDGLTPVYFVDLKLRNAAGEVVSRNFYWLSSKRAGRLPPAGRSAAGEVEGILRNRALGRGERHPRAGGESDRIAWRSSSTLC